MQTTKREGKLSRSGQSAGTTGHRSVNGDRSDSRHQLAAEHFSLRAGVTQELQVVFDVTTLFQMIKVSAFHFVDVEVKATANQNEKNVE